MSSETPPAPPEAEVIRLARMAMGMTAQRAAEATKKHDARGVGATYWGDVERGYGGRRGQRVVARASDRALAAMARVVGVAPQQLTDAGRGEAAKVLEEILRREHPPLAAVPDEAPVEAHVIDLMGRMIYARADPLEIKVWETESISKDDRAKVIIALWERKTALAAELAGKSNGGKSSGTALSVAST